MSTILSPYLSRFGSCANNRDTGDRADYPNEDTSRKLAEDATAPRGGWKPWAERGMKPQVRFFY